MPDLLALGRHERMQWVEETALGGGGEVTTEVDDLLVQHVDTHGGRY